MNVILAEENGKIVRADLGHGVWVSEMDGGSQSTELHDTDISAAKSLMRYLSEGISVPQRAQKEAMAIIEAG